MLVADGELIKCIHCMQGYIVLQLILGGWHHSLKMHAVVDLIYFCQAQVLHQLS